MFDWSIENGLWNWKCDRKRLCTYIQPVLNIVGGHSFCFKYYLNFSVPCCYMFLVSTSHFVKWSARKLSQANVITIKNIYFFVPFCLFQINKFELWRIIRRRHQRRRRLCPWPVLFFVYGLSIVSFFLFVCELWRRKRATIYSHVHCPNRTLRFHGFRWCWQNTTKPIESSLAFFSQHTHYVRTHMCHKIVSIVCEYFKSFGTPLNLTNNGRTVVLQNPTNNHSVRGRKIDTRARCRN